jgi:hypothetical protein
MPQVEIAAASGRIALTSVAPHPTLAPSADDGRSHAEIIALAR